MAIFQLKPAFKEYVWGGRRLIEEYHKEYGGDILAESWELSCHPDGASVILNGTYSGCTLRDYLEKKGKTSLGSNCDKFEDFPILIKFIDAKDNLSIQVHPDNAYALKEEQQYGKTEMWYVLDAQEGAYLYYGFCEDISKEEFERKIVNGTLTEALNKIYVQKGDILFIEAGTIHAIGANIMIAEIQQNSNVTYRVYDYGRTDKNGNTRELHVQKALDVTTLSAMQRSKNFIPHIAQCEYFTVDKLYLDGSTIASATGVVGEQSFVHILFLEGQGNICCQGENLTYQKGDSFFIEAGSGNYEVSGECEALITTIK